jgi:hypothetical protein
MDHGRRQILWFGVTPHPTAEWIAVIRRGVPMPIGTVKPLTSLIWAGSFHRADSQHGALSGMSPEFASNRTSLPSSFLDPAPASAAPKLFITRRVEHALDVAVQHEHEKTGPRGAAQDQTVVCLTAATALEDLSAVRPSAASARNPRRSHWAKAQTAIRRPGCSRNADSRAPWRRAHTRSSGRPAGPQKRLAS